MRKYLFLLSLCTLLLFAAAPAWAAEPATPELTVNDTIKLALEHSETIKSANFDVDSSDLERENKLQELGYTSTVATGDPTYESAYASLLNANLTWSMSEKTLSLDQDAVALDACNQYWNLQKAIVSVDTAKISLQKADADYQKASVYNRVGLTSNAELLSAATALASAKSSLEEAQNTLEKTYTSFNQLVGLQSADRPVLTEEAVYEPLDDKTDVNYLVAKVIADSPTVWLAEKKLDMQKTLEDLAFYTGEYTSYKVRENTTEQAKINVTNAKDAADTLTRSIYYSVRTLEDNYASADQAVKLAEENLRVTEVKYQAGMAIKADVVSSQASLASAKQKLLELKINHAYLKLALEKPWAYQ